MPSSFVPMKLPSTRLPVVPAPVMVMPLSLLPEMRLLRRRRGSADHIPRCADRSHAHSVGEEGGAVLVGADEVALHQVARRAGCR